MEFLKILKGHFWTHGIDEPISYLASELDANPETIRVYCRRANNGVGSGDNQLSPQTAAWLIEQSWKVMDKNELRNPVQKFLQPQTESEK